MTDDDSPGAAAGSAARPSLSLDTVFEVLAARRRRFALYALAGAPDGVLTLDALVEDVATLEAALAGGAFTRDRYFEAATELYEWHLPVLADVGLVDCDARHETVRYLPHPTLETWVERVGRDELG